MLCISQNQVYFMTYMKVHDQFPEYDLSIHPCSIMFLDATENNIRVRNGRRHHPERVGWTSGMESE